MSDAEAVVEETETSAGFKAIGEQRFFAEYFEQFDALADEMKLHLNDGGLFGIVVDPASVGMVPGTASIARRWNTTRRRAASSG